MFLGAGSDLAQQQSDIRSPRGTSMALGAGSRVKRFFRGEVPVERLKQSPIL